MRKTFRKGTWSHLLTPAREAMRLHGYTYSSLAQHFQKQGLHISAQQIVRVVRGDTEVPELRQIIAKALGFPVDRLWPERRVA